MSHQPYFKYGATGAVARTTQGRAEETIISVMDFGAKGDGVTDDTAAFQAAIDYANSIGGGNVMVPMKRFFFSGVLSLKQNVGLIGEREGPFEAGGNFNTGTFAPTLMVTNTVSAFLTCVNPGSAGNQAVRNLAFTYPNQILPTNAGAITVYPFTLWVRGGGVAISNCTFCNSYDAVFINNGRNSITKCIFGNLHYGVKLDVSVDWFMMSDSWFVPFYTYMSFLSFPQNIDNTTKTNGSACWYILRADGPLISNCGAFGLWQYGFYLDAGVTPGFSGPSYGRAVNIDLDSLQFPIYAKSTLGIAYGWNFTNIDIGSGAGQCGIYLAAGGADPPVIDICNGCMRGTWPLGDYSINAGSLTMKSFRPIGDIPGRVLATPGVPASGVALTNPFPFDVDVYLVGGTITDVAIGGNGTGGISRQYVRLPARITITLFYTVAPTWVWFC